MSECPCKKFVQVTDEDINELIYFLSRAQYEESNHNVVNMIMWRNFYPLWICRQPNYISLIGRHLGQWFMYMPLCEEKYFEEAVLCTKQYFDEARISFVMSCFTEKEMLKVKAIVPDVQIIEDRDGFDYVYEKEKLISFSGKKLQKKRNHLNAFYNEYQNRYQYEEMTVDNLKECEAFLNQWKLNDEDRMSLEERKGVKEIFRLWEKLPCNGGLIRIDGEVKAFIIGSHSSERMGQINVEKADSNIRGLYQAILKEYLQRHLKSCQYLNREDDMGLESLRRAKQAYHPCWMIHKYRLIVG